MHAERRYSTAINRRAVAGPILLTALGFEGDHVADAENHGGPDRAACCYCHEHYPYWSQRLTKDLALPSFGENLTTENMLERDVCIGDTYQIGTAVVQVSQPRQPCWKLANKLHAPQIINWITELAYTGFYLRVLEEGHIQTGDTATLLDRPNPQITVALTASCILTSTADPELLARLARLPELSAGWRIRADRRLLDA